MFLKTRIKSTMKNYYNKSNGYIESIEKGISAVRKFDLHISEGIGTTAEQLDRLKKELKNADSILVGAGAGLSTSAGFTYSGERFQKYFFDFASKYGITDMYSGGFYPFPDEETMWAWWARHIYFNRYIDASKPVYTMLLDLIKDKDYFVITTNVDHQFQRSGFDKNRLFYTQGDYGLFQSVNPKIKMTFDNEEWTFEAMKSQGFVIGEDGKFALPKDKNIKMSIPHNLIPKTPNGDSVKMNLRSDNSFVEDIGWHNASSKYADFISEHTNSSIIYLELGVGSNTPMIIKYPFWAMTKSNKNSIYACLNFNEAYCPKEIEKQSICINNDILKTLEELNYDN